MRWLIITTLESGVGIQRRSFTVVQKKCWRRGWTWSSLLYSQDAMACTLWLWDLLIWMLREQSVNWLIQIRCIIYAKVILTGAAQVKAKNQRVDAKQKKMKRVRPKIMDTVARILRTSRLARPLIIFWKIYRTFYRAKKSIAKSSFQIPRPFMCIDSRCTF